MRTLNEFSSLLIMGAVVVGVCVAVGNLLPEKMSSGAAVTASLPPESVLLEAEMAALRKRSKCDECGVVESTRGVERVVATVDLPTAVVKKGSARQQRVAAPIDSYEVMVRMEDGSNRMFSHAPPANWRVGERLMLIAGTPRP
jgi:hypothetical protein